MTKNNPNTGNLTTPQRKALGALAAGATKAQAATLAGRTERTLNRWLSEDETFAEAVKATNAQAVTDASRRLATMLDLAVDVLHDLMSRDSVADHTRLRAVAEYRNTLIGLRQIGDLEERIKALEELTQ